MYMRVKFEFLSPTVQHAKEANFRTEMLGVAGHFEKSFRTGAKQEIVEHFLVLPIRQYSFQQSFDRGTQFGPRFA